MTIQATGLGSERTSASSRWIGRDRFIHNQLAATL